MRTHSRKLAGALLIPLLFSLTGAQPFTKQQEQQSSKPEPATAQSEMVKMRVTVTDGQGRYLPGLSREDFVVEIEKTPHPISYFSAQAEPFSVVFLVDISGSMQHNGSSKLSRVSVIAEAVQNFLQVAHPANEYLIASFGREPRLHLDWTRDKSAIIAALTDLAKEKPQGQTAMRDACFFGLGQAKRGTQSGKALILFSDGVDNAAENQIRSVTPQRLKQELQESETLAYSINLGSLRFSQMDGPNFGMEFGGGRDALENFAKPTGGRAFHPLDVASLKAALEAIAVELRVQYVLGFDPPARAGQVFTKVKVRLAPNVGNKHKVKGLLARHREGYLAVVSQK